jgi:hypothetical protein
VWPPSCRPVPDRPNTPSIKSINSGLGITHTSTKRDRGEGQAHLRLRCPVIRRPGQGDWGRKGRPRHRLRGDNRATVARYPELRSPDRRCQTLRHFLEGLRARRNCTFRLPAPIRWRNPFWRFSPPSGDRDPPCKCGNGAMTVTATVCTGMLSIMRSAAPSFERKVVKTYVQVFSD